MSTKLNRILPERPTFARKHGKNRDRLWAGSQFRDFMKILHINKFFWLAGGIERYMFDISRQQRDAGHETVFFAMQHPNNRPCDQDEFFPSHVEFRGTSVAYKVRNAPAIVARSIHSPDTRRKLAALIEREKPDVAHVHLITHQLSPSVLSALIDAQVPAVMTVHEHSLRCPSGRRYVPHLDETCRRCFDGSLFNAVRHRCVQDRTLPSLLAATAVAAHRRTRIYERGVGQFLCPSETARAAALAGGIDESRTRLLPYAIDLRNFEANTEPGDYFFCYGRLTPEKGQMTLLEAAALAPDIRIRIAGTGPDEDRLKAFARETNLANVEFTGFLDGTELHDAIRGARAVVIPSNYYETGPLTCLEAFAFGKPVIGTDLGGIRESINTGKTGLLVPPRDALALRGAMLELSANDPLCREMGRVACDRARAQCREHMDALFEAYDHERTVGN